MDGSDRAPAANAVEEDTHPDNDNDDDMTDSDKWYFAKFWTWEKIQLDRRRIDLFVRQHPRDWRARFYRQVIAAHEAQLR
jgi:hypothetical protein